MQHLPVRHGSPGRTLLERVGMNGQAFRMIYNNATGTKGSEPVT